MLHELRTYVLAPGRLDEYLEVSATIGRPIRGDTCGRLEGHWYPAAGNPDRVVHLWTYSDFAERERLRGELAKNERWRSEFLVLLPPLVERQETRILTPVEPLVAPASDRMVYELCCDRARIGGLVRWTSAIRDAATGAPEGADSGHLVGLWQTAIGPLNELVHLWAYSSMSAVLDVRGRRQRDPRWEACRELPRELLVERTVELLCPSPSSPMR